MILPVCHFTGYDLQFMLPYTFGPEELKTSCWEWHHDIFSENNEANLAGLWEGGVRSPCSYLDVPTWISKHQPINILKIPEMLPCQNNTGEKIPVLG